MPPRGLKLKLLPLPAALPVPAWLLLPLALPAEFPLPLFWPLLLPLPEIKLSLPALGLVTEPTVLVRPPTRPESAAFWGVGAARTEAESAKMETAMVERILMVLLIVDEEG
jgi:hypothetical protein